MQKENHAEKIHELLQICQEHHLKITPQRVAIYKELLKLDTHPTADTIYKRLPSN